MLLTCRSYRISVLRATGPLCVQAFNLRNEEDPLRGEPAVGCRETGRLLGWMSGWVAGLCTQRQSTADSDPTPARLPLLL